MAGERELVAHFLTHLHGYIFLNRAENFYKHSAHRRTFAYEAGAKGGVQRAQ
jgi:hypothetical protein